MLTSLLFPDHKPLQEILSNYPRRSSEQIVTRIAPSPTGFLHVGTVYTALLNEQFAHQSWGRFLLRIEDTDQARNTTDHENQSWGIYSIIHWLEHFDIPYDEGMILDTNNQIISNGSYWPYQQSQRLKLYQSWVAYLLETDQAYVCFMSPQELENMRVTQQLDKQPTGVYGNYALSRGLSETEVIGRITQWDPWVIRRKATNKPWERVNFHDGIKWMIDMEANYMDHILIKSDGFPSYHLAHIIDDYLMGTTHVIRADERLASVPFHIQLFKWFESMLDRPMWKYNHNSAILKLDNGNKRKLSKRKDPEADVQTLVDQWYPTQAIKLYLMSLVNSWFEDRRRSQNSQWNEYVSYHRFPISLDKCNNAWAIFDLAKLHSLCADYLSMIPVSQLKKELQEFYSHTGQMSIALEENESYLESVLSFDRNKKLHVTYQDIVDYILPFFQDSLSISDDLFPSSISPDQRKEILNEYKNYITQELFDDQWVIQKTKEEWFDDLKWFGKRYHIAGNKKEFEMWWYIAQIGDLAMILRVLLYGKLQTPDIYEMIKIYGLQKTLKRLW